MNIVFLTSESAHHYFLINKIHKSFPVKKVFLQEIDQQQRPWRHKLKTLLKFRKLRFAIRDKILGLLFRNEELQEKHYEQEVLFNGAQAFLESSILHERVFSFNDQEVVKKVEAQNPDLIIVFGTEILRGGILNAAKKAILNIHRGIVPKYKGGGMPSWVFYNKDFDYLGVTVHLCTNDLDSGDMVGQEFYRIQKDDKIFTLRCKTTILASDILKEVISDYIQGKIKYIKQAPGKTWTRKDLTIMKEVTARRNFKEYIQGLKA